MSTALSAPYVERPLTIDQEGRLFLESWMNLRSTPYLPAHLHAGLKLSGDVDAAALEDAFNDVIARHEALRTGFVGVITAGGRGGRGRDPSAHRVERPGRGMAEGRSAFRQIVVPSAKLTLAVESIEHVPAAEQPLALERLAGELVTVPFDYERPPLLRALLVRQSPREHAVIIVLHHLVGDGWSLGVLAQELATVYSARLAGEPACLPAPAAQFADFAVWQRQRLHDGTRARLAAHAAAAYRDFASVQVSCHDLPFAGPRGGRIRGGGCETLMLDRSLSPPLRVFARQRRLSLYMVLLGALMVVLRQYTGKARLGVWGHFANRTRPEFERVIGWFSTFRLLAADFAGDPALDQVLEQTRAAVFDAVAYQDLPFTLLWDAIRSGGDAGAKAPRVFGESHVSFNFVAWTKWRWPGISRMHPATFRPGGGERALRITAVDSVDDLMLFARFPGEILPSAAVRQTLVDLEHVLAAMVARPDIRSSAFAGTLAGHSFTAAATGSVGGVAV